MLGLDWLASGLELRELGIYLEIGRVSAYTYIARAEPNDLSIRIPHLETRRLFVSRWLEGKYPEFLQAGVKSHACCLTKCQYPWHWRNTIRISEASDVASEPFFYYPYIQAGSRKNRGRMAHILLYMVLGDYASDP